MLTTSASIALGLAFILLGGINVWLVLEALSRVKTARAGSRLLTLHRIGGYQAGRFAAQHTQAGSPRECPSALVATDEAAVPCSRNRRCCREYFRLRSGIKKHKRSRA
jgi:hypothetical protein